MTEHHRRQVSSYLQSHKSRQNQRDKKSENESRKKTSTLDSAHKNTDLGRTEGKSDVPVLFTSSTRSRSSYLMSRRKPPAKITGKASINHLPDELLLKIFSYLGPGELLVSAGVCRRWLPLATDNLLWNKIYEQFGKIDLKARGQSADGPVNYKALCIKSCKTRRNRRVGQYLSRISPFTGLPRDTDKALKTGGVYFQLCFIDRDDKEHSLRSKDVFHHAMSTCVRWYDLDLPTLRSMKKVKVYAVNPLFFSQSGIAIKHSPYQRSLLLNMDFDWNKWLQTTKPIGSDDMVNLYSLPSGLLIATWKGDGGLAFVCLGLHNNMIVPRCLHGTVQEQYDMGTHKVIPDDITTNYGLIGYQCTVEIRTLRNSIWSQQFTNLFCKKENIGFAVFPLIRKDCVVDQVILQKKLEFPWKTDAFRGIVKDVVWIDVTVLDERNEKFWCISSATKTNGQRLEDNVSFDYTNQDVFVMSYRDERGKIEANMKQTDDQDFFITSLELRFSLDAINQWFGTAYS